MNSAIIRVALLQFVAIIYCILCVGVFLKLRGDFFPLPSFAMNLREYGYLLFLIPVSWLTWASISLHSRRAETGDIGLTLVIGYLLLGSLVFLAYRGTLSAVTTESLIQSSPAPHVPAIKPVTAPPRSE